MVQQISTALIYVSYFSGVVPLYFLNKKFVFKSALYRLFGVFLAISFLSDLISFLLAKTEVSNIPIGNIYLVLMLIVLSLMYSKMLGVSSVILKICICCIVFFIVNSLYMQGLTTFQNYTLALYGIILIAYSMVYYEQLIQTIPARNILSYPLFWINSAIAYYFCLNLFLFFVSTYAFENLNPNEVLAIWIFHNVNNIAKNALFTVGLLKLTSENIDSHNVDN